MTVVGEARRRRHRANFAVLSLIIVAMLVATYRVACASSDSPSPPSAGRQGETAGSIMVVGDSVSQGMEGDYTWRYRLFQHFAANKVQLRFVGPWTGTNVLPLSQPDDYPQTSTPPSHDGAYRQGISFSSANLAQWGWTVRQARDVVGSAVRRYQPDYLLVELGFNDLAFNLLSPADLAAELHTLVRNVQAARPSIRIILGNVFHGEPSGASDSLRSRIAQYDAVLAGQVGTWSTQRSSVALADLAGGYIPAVDSYDGVHPDAAGEIKIAEVFADSLSARYGIGPRFSSPLAAVSDVEPPTPLSITAAWVNGRILVRWPHSFGAEGYMIYVRDLTTGESFQKAPLPLTADSWTFGDLVDGHVYQYQVAAARGAHESGRSPIATVAAIADVP